MLKKLLLLCLKKIDYGSAIAVRLTKITGKSKEPIHPKHFLTLKPWYSTYVNNTDRVLDLGCGNGQSAIKISKISKAVIAVDINNDSLTIASRSAGRLGVKNIKFDKANLEGKLKFKRNSFDKIIFLDVLEHLQNRDQILQEVKRILRPGGLLFLGVPNSQTSWKKLQRSVGICSFSDPDHKIEFSESQIRKLLSNHGFTIKNFGYDHFDTPLRGIFDVIGGFSLPVYERLSSWRQEKTKKNPQESGGFEIIATNS